MDYYEIWFDLKDGSRDLDLSTAIADYLGYLQAHVLIERYRLSRRKLGFGPTDLREFHITIETRDLTQLDAAFQRAATRDSEVEPLHAGVYSLVTNARFASIATSQTRFDKAEFDRGRRGQARKRGICPRKMRHDAKQHPESVMRCSLCPCGSTSLLTF